MGFEKHFTWPDLLTLAHCRKGLPRNKILKRSSKVIMASPLLPRFFFLQHIWPLLDHHSGDSFILSPGCSLQQAPISQSMLFCKMDGTILIALVPLEIESNGAGQFWHLVTENGYHHILITGVTGCLPL